ncbi:MAG: LOG family protein [Nocardioidaceae bacterium]
MTIEVESVAQFDELVSSGAAQMGGWLLQDLDLRERTDQLLGLKPSGALFMGCELTHEAIVHLRTGGALLFPNIPELPFDPYRAALYTPDDLYAGMGESTYNDTPDARIYAWSRRRDGDLVFPLARALHDHAIDHALEDELRGKRVVGVMGGHALSRDDDGYADAAHLGHRLAATGSYVVTGGGPGAMEAANLGAYLSGRPETVLTDALTMVAGVPGFAPSVGDWAQVAFDVRRRWTDGEATIGIPTWFYGHEPPNAFASAIAKYFQNSLREDTLLRHCDAGIVFLPGAGGTVQEIFQDACENYYADEGTLTPMVLVGKEHWSVEVPAWPLLKNLAKGRPMEEVIHLVDSVHDVPEALG